MTIESHAKQLDELYMECIERLTELSPGDPEFELVKKKAKFFQEQRDREIENELKADKDFREHEELELKQVREMRETAAMKDAAKREMRKTILEVGLDVLRTGTSIGTGCYWMHRYRTDALCNYPLTTPDKSALEPMKMLNAFSKK